MEVNYDRGALGDNTNNVNIDHLDNAVDEPLDQKKTKYIQYVKGCQIPFVYFLHKSLHTSRARI